MPTPDRGNIAVDRYPDAPAMCMWAFTVHTSLICWTAKRYVMRDCRGKPHISCRNRSDRHRYAARKLEGEGLSPLRLVRNAAHDEPRRIRRPPQKNLRSADIDVSLCRDSEASFRDAVQPQWLPASRQTGHELFRQRPELYPLGRTTRAGMGVCQQGGRAGAVAIVKAWLNLILEITRFTKRAPSMACAFLRAGRLSSSARWRLSRIPAATADEPNWR